MVVHPDDISKHTDQKPGEPTPEEPHDSGHPGHIDPDLPRLRTFADDLSDELKKKNATLTSIVAEERERAAREVAFDDEPESPRFKNPVLLIGALVLVAAGTVALIGAYLYTAWIEPASAPEVTSIIFPNKVVAFEVSEHQRFTEILAGERFSASLSLGEIERMDVTLEHATTTVRTLLEQFNPPPALLREATALMLGIHSFDRNQPFIIIEVTQYDRAYGAMLEWEEEMGRGLGSFFKPREGTVPPTLTFTDRVLQNIDTRISQAEWPILYAFPRRDVLVITTNQYTLSEILTRLNAQQGGTVLP